MGVHNNIRNLHIKFYYIKISQPILNFIKKKITENWNFFLKKKR